MDNLPVITGMGVLCSLGSNPETLTAKLIQGDSRFRPAGFDSPVLAGRTVAPIEDFQPKRHLKQGKSHRYMSRETNLAACALSLCMAHSGIRESGAYQDRDISLFAGTGSSGMDLSFIQNMLDHSAHETTGLFDDIRFGNHGIHRMNPLISFKILPNMPVAVGSIETSIKGRSLIFNPWEGNALSAVNEAWYGIQSQRESLVFCGGSDCKTHTDAFITFCEYGLFEQNGVVLSEGSAYVALEDPTRAIKRGAKVYAAIRNMASRSVVPDNLIGYTPQTKLYADLMQEALTTSGLEPDDIDLVLDSRDFHEANDHAEALAIDRVFGPVAALSPKKITGNAFAASGYIALVAAAHILGSKSAIHGKTVRRILVNSFANGSEKHVIILEGP